MGGSVGETEPLVAKAVLLDGRLFATCAGFLADSYDLFTIDLVVLILQIQYGEELISTGAKSLMVSTMLLGVVCGQLFFGSLSDWLGRKWAFVATALLTVLSALAGALCVDGAWRLPQQLALCRFLLGFGVGGEYPLSATVSAESVDDAQGRGRVMALVLSMQGFGMMLAALLAMALAKTASLEATWRLLLAFGALPSAVAFGLRWQLQESEVFIKSKAVEGDHGRRVLETLADYWPRLVGTAGAWMLLNVFTYSLGSFKSSIFEPGLGAASADDVFQQALFAAVTSGFAILGFGAGLLLVQRASRFHMQLYGFLSLAAVFGAVSGFSAFAKQTAVTNLIALGLVFFLMNAGPNLTTYILPAEVFPTCVRGTFHGISAASGKLGAFLGTVAFPPLQQHQGMSAVYGACGLASLLAAVLTYFLTPRVATSLEKLELLGHSL